MRPSHALFAALLLLATNGCGWIPAGTTVTRSQAGLTVDMPGSPLTVGSGQFTEEERTTESFGGVHVGHGFDLRIDPELAPGTIIVRIDDNLHELVETVVEDDLLTVRAIGSLQTETPVLVRVSPETIRGLKASQNAVIDVDTVLTVPRLSLTASTSGRVNAEAINGDDVRLIASTSGRIQVDSLDGQSLQATVSTSGKVDVTAGQVDETNVSASTSGNYHAAEVASRVAEVSASTSGKIDVRATEVSGSASTSGKVHCYGDPTKVEVNTSTSGKVVRVE